MPTLRETLDEAAAEHAAPTKFQTKENKYQVACSVCEDLFFVDESTYRFIRRAADFDPTDNPFRCDECEQEYNEESLI